MKPQTLTPPACPPEFPEVAAVCMPVHLRPLPGGPGDQLSYAPLPLHREFSQLEQDLAAAPQFRKIPLRTLLKERRGSLRVILLGDSHYYACQAAFYLSALARLWDARQARSKEGDDFWDMAELDAYFPADEKQGPNLKDALLVIAPQLLDPELSEGTASGTAHPHLPKQGALDADELSISAVLVSCIDGPPPTRQVVQGMNAVGKESDGRQADRFLALRPEQVDLELLEELRFHQGFHVVRLGRPDQAYLRRFLQVMAQELMMPISSSVDLDQVIAGVRRYRGSAFSEQDLEALLMWAVQRQAAPPLQLKDLQFHPYRLEARGWDTLERMVGLGPVKAALRRMLAASALDARRRQAGSPAAPACRNLAFSGPPGTGKSVTARLVARILREEGCGTGRFVEAGREQLIGPYLGQTSHMVAKLFRQAKGGVLFIDEAGALLDRTGQDSYAAEAVNALVRHMELEPETVVIFATYPDEMKRLLSANPGLSSRVAQVPDFESYDDGQLWDILQVLAGQNGYTLPAQAREICLDFFATLHRQKGEQFGNGREARRLFQAAVEEMALRTLRSTTAEESLTAEDLETAARRLLEQEITTPPSPIGF